MLPLQRQHQLFSHHPLTRDRPLSAWGRFIAWQLRSRLQRDCVVDWVAGSQLLVRRGMTGATGNIYCGLHECADMAFVLHLLRPGDLFGDIGANVGSYSVLAAKVCGAQVLAVEPDPKAAESLRANLTLNSVLGVARVAQTAVGDRQGHIQFTTGLDTMNKVDVSGQHPGGQTVPLTTLDSLFQGLSPTLLKIDVEGFEAQVLRGAHAVLTNPRLLAVQSECQEPEVVEQLRRHGFEEWHYDPFRRALTREVVVPHGNGLYLRGLEEVRNRLASAPRTQVLHHTV